MMAFKEQGANPDGRADDNSEAIFENDLHQKETLDFLKNVFQQLNSESVRQEGLQFIDEFISILKGQSSVSFDKDSRFKDETWRKNFLYKRWGQTYLAFCDTMNHLVDSEFKDWRHRQQAKFITELVTSTFSPTNLLIGNPEAMREAVRSKGVSLGKGFRNFLHDLRHNRGMPSQVDATAYKLGENIAVSPGAVVFRNDQMEVLQYKPATAQVYQIPIFIISPQINRYYFLDLSPGRSFVEYLVSQGYQVFVASWRNPGPEHCEWGFNHYCHAVTEAIDAIRQICGVKSVNTFGFCAGGLTMTSVLGWLEHNGQSNKVNAISYAVTLMDFSSPSTIGMFQTETVAAAAKWNSNRTGLMSGESLASLFTLLRPNDLIWKYWVNNYLMGKPAPSFDILAWNSHATNLPAQLHEDFLNIFINNSIAKPGTLTINGAPINAGNIEQDSFVVAAMTDHLTPWTGCYRTTQLLGGESTFVLCNSGHIAGLVNPPGNPKATYMTGSKPGKDHKEWLESAVENKGSWWECWINWASTRSGNLRKAKTKLGSSKYPVLCDAPGTYVKG